MHARFVASVVVSFGLLGCARATPEVKASPSTAQAPAAGAVPAYGKLNRLEFNRRAAQRNLPLFWRADANTNGQLDPEELSVVWTSKDVSLDEYVLDGGFTPAFRDGYAALTAELSAKDVDPKETARRQKVLEELAQGRPTLLETDLRGANLWEREVVAKLFKVARTIERLHARQKGTLGLEAEIPKDDLASQALFFRNQGPFCEAPKTEKDPDCSALPSRPKPVFGLYPAALQKDAKFCEALEKQKNAKALMDHFSVVVESPRHPGKFEAVPYSKAYAEDVARASEELLSAAAVVPDEEAPFRAYLTQAARAFTTNNWVLADEAWVKMNARNSKWYLRVGPDEVYYEPCAWKAGFHLSLARINPDSLAWQEKLAPHKEEMEKALAAMAGPPYRARKVAFSLPDFIDIVVNAGDDRSALGATVGQSLPNWGKVADAGGRTVAMTNLYTDTDSRAALETQMASVFCKDTMARASTDPGPILMSTVLHEAAHNLGPAHEYKVKGKVDEVLFGGPLAAILEELKSEVAAVYFSQWLADKGVVPREEADRAHVRDVAWAVGHVASGMLTPEGKPKTYSQLSSVLLGFLRKEGALTWRTDEVAANGTDKGCFSLDETRQRVAIEALAKKVLQVKARGEKAEAERLRAAFVDADDDWKALRAVLTERWLRAPKASFVYSVKG